MLASFFSVSDTWRQRIPEFPEKSLANTLRSSHQVVFCKKGVLKNFAKFTGKHLHKSCFFDKVSIY